MSKLAYFVHGRGRGHASRSGPIIDHLRSLGHDVDVFAGGQALDLLANDPQLTKIDSVLPGFAAPRNIWTRVARDVQSLRQIDAQIVLTDGDAPSLFAAHRLRLPTIALGHGLIFGNCALPRLPRKSRTFEALNALSSSFAASRIVAVHFLHAKPLNRKTRVARPDLTDIVDLVRQPTTPGVRPKILSYFRDENGARILEAAAARGAEICHFGQVAQPVVGVETRPLDRHGFLEEFIRCDAVIASAGSNVLAEAIALQKPVLALYHARDREQMMNALLLESARLGISAPIDTCRDSDIARFLHRTRAGDFSTYPLLEALPPVSQQVAACLSELLSP